MGNSLQPLHSSWMKPTEPRTRNIGLSGDRPQAPTLSIPGAPFCRRAGISGVSHSGLQPGRMYTQTSWMSWSFRSRVGSSKCPLLFILWFHWRSSSWAPGLARCSQCCRCHTCHSDIQRLLGTYTGSLRGEHSQALWPSRTPAPWRYMFSGCWTWLDPCTLDPEWFKRVRLQYSASFCLA